MRLAALASLLTAGVIALAMGVAPMPSRADSQPAPCSTCGKAKSTTPSSCAQCDKGTRCASCAGGANEGYRGHHGTRAAHRWQYKCVRPSKKPDAMTQQFNAMGDRGWRLKDADGGIWCFARMKPSQ